MTNFVWLSNSDREIEGDSDSDSDSKSDTTNSDGGISDSSHRNGSKWQ